MGVALESNPSDDSFEKYFSKELDLEERKFASYIQMKYRSFYMN